MMDQKTAEKFTFTHTPETPCRILAGRVRRDLQAEFNVNADPMTAADNGAMNAAGFDKSLSLSMYFKQACQNCSACKPTRILVNDYAWSRSERQIINRNEDLQVTINPAPAAKEHQGMFLRNFEARHKNGYEPHMQMMIRHIFRVSGMLEHRMVPNSVMEIRRDGKLVGTSIYDDVNDGLKANYYYYEPDEMARRSLGTFIILKMIEQARAEDKPYLYLGALTREPSKVQYKSRFKPMEILDGGKWVPFVA